LRFQVRSTFDCHNVHNQLDRLHGMSKIKTMADLLMHQGLNLVGLR
jgi:hypothetical protein